MGLAINVEDRYYSSDAAFYSLAYSRMGRSDPVIGMDYANTLAEQGDFVHAAAIYRELIKAWPSMWAAYFNLGYMYYQQGDLDSAIQYLSRTAAGDPANAAAIFYLGLADLKLHHLDEAEANLRRAIVLAPTAPNYHFALGMVLKVKGNWPGAMAEFARELELNPATPSRGAAGGGNSKADSRKVDIRSLSKVRYNRLKPLVTWISDVAIIMGGVQPVSGSELCLPSKSTG